jgi:geranylgeranyl diphosphate synthase type II
MDFENRLDVTEAEYLEMIRLKTAVLLGCSLQAGALLANAADETAEQLYNFGINLGMAFQLQDDWLDTFGDPQKFGKKIGGDIVANKKTYLLIAALEKAAEGTKSTLDKWLKATEFNAEEKINSVTEMYKQLGIKEITEAKIEYFFLRAAEILNQLPVNDLSKKHLIELSNNMLGRSS